MGKQYARRIIAALLAVALGLGALGAGHGQQAGNPNYPQQVADPGANGGGTGG